jgi:alanyl-tRNA synthetase
MPRERAESLYGFRLYQGGVVPGRDVRVVKIGDWDVEACGGTHCRTTGEVGFIKILRSERIQDGVERVVFAAGIPAVKASQERDEALRKISETCKVQVKLEDVAKVADAVERLFSSWKQSRKEVEKLEDELVKSEAKRLVMDARAVANVKLLTQVAKNVSVERLIKLAAELVRIEPKLVVALFRVDKDVRIVTMVGDGARELGIHAGNLAEEVASVVGGAGGGKADFGQGGGPLAEKVQLAIKKAEDLLAG